MGKKYGSKDKKEGYLKKNSDYCLVIKIEIQDKIKSIYSNKKSPCITA